MARYVFREEPNHKDKKLLHYEVTTWNMFKRRLDKHWENQKIQYCNKAALTTTDTDIRRGKDEMEKHAGYRAKSGITESPV